MAGGKVYGSSNMTVLLQNKRLPCSPDVFYSVWVPSSDPSLQGSTSTVDFDVSNARETIDQTYFLRSLDKEEDGGSDDCDMFFHQAGKKRRLTTDQVRFLEKSFEVENKLEPERKIQLANELGLLPRQVAIWFQNRRARFKTKQLEKDYCSLKACYEKLKFDYDNLLNENGSLKNEVKSLKCRLLSAESGNKNDKGYSVDEAVKKSDKETVKPISKVPCENGMGVVTVGCKQEDVSSVKSDVFDADSPHYTDCNHSTFLEPADSSHAFGPDHSDFSQDEDDNLSKSILPFQQFLHRTEDACYEDPTDNSCHFGFPVEDQNFCFWP